mgnify:CR=1 FL=1
MGWEPPYHSRRRAAMTGGACCSGDGKRHGRSVVPRRCRGPAGCCRTLIAAAVAPHGGPTVELHDHRFVLRPDRLLPAKFLCRDRSPRDVLRGVARKPTAAGRSLRLRARCWPPHDLSPFPAVRGCDADLRSRGRGCRCLLGAHRNALGRSGRASRRSRLQQDPADLRGLLARRLRSCLRHMAGTPARRALAAAAVRVHRHLRGRHLAVHLLEPARTTARGHSVRAQRAHRRLPWMARARRGSLCNCRRRHRAHGLRGSPRDPVRTAQGAVAPVGGGEGSALAWHPRRPAGRRQPGCRPP